MKAILIILATFQNYFPENLMTRMMIMASKLPPLQLNAIEKLRVLVMFSILLGIIKRETRLNQVMVMMMIMVSMRLRWYSQIYSQFPFTCAVYIHTCINNDYDEMNSFLSIMAIFSLRNDNVYFCTV